MSEISQWSFGSKLINQKMLDMFEKQWKEFSSRAGMQGVNTGRNQGSGLTWIIKTMMVESTIRNDCLISVFGPVRDRSGPYTPT